MLKLIKNILLSFTLFSASVFAGQNIDVYMQPHPDDSFIFYGNKLTQSVQNTNKDVVIILLTAGQDTYNLSGLSNNPYYKARVRGLLSALALLKDGNQDGTKGQYIDIRNEKRLTTSNGKSIAYFIYKNITVYQLRLTDGNLAALVDNTTTPYPDIEGVNVYANATDLQNTILDIISQKTKEVPSGIASSYSNNKSTVNLYTNTNTTFTTIFVPQHTDHRAAGRLASAIQTAKPCINVSYFYDYNTEGGTLSISSSISFDGTNYTATADFWRATIGALAAYNGETLVSGAYNTFILSHIRWMAKERLDFTSAGTGICTF